MAKNVLYFRPSNDELAKAKAIKTYLQGRGRGALNRWLTEAMFEKWEREATTVRKKGTRQPSKLVDDGSKQIHMDVPKEFVKKVAQVQAKHKVSKNDAIMYMVNSYEWSQVHEKLVGEDIKAIMLEAADLVMTGSEEEHQEFKKRFGLTEAELNAVCRQGMTFKSNRGLDIYQ